MLAEARTNNLWVEHFHGEKLPEIWNTYYGFIKLDPVQFLGT